MSAHIDQQPISAPPSDLSRVWFWARVAGARLRFVAILGIIGLIITQWDLLVAKYEKYVRPATAAAVSGDHEYFCPMHPTVIRETNAEKCPICFMPLSKRKKGEPNDDVLEAGTISRVQLSPYRILLAGVQTHTVAYQPLRKEISTVGSVEFDERALRHVAARVKGRIDKLFVNQTGQLVAKGDPLASLYSPDLVVTVQNLLDARQSNNRDLEQNARERLRRWGIDDPQIEEVVKTGKPITTLTVRSPIDGHVTRKYQREGQYVEEGGPLYDVADVTTVWVQAQLYEEDIAFLPTGSHDPKAANRRLAVTATARAFPGRTFEGMLTFLYPHIDPESRTLTVRFEVDNADHELRPGMTATVTLSLAADEMAPSPASKRLIRTGKTVLAVPESSVIDTGRQTVVYRQYLPGTYDGVLVELGARMTGPAGEVFYPVLKGLAAGDTVVTAGSFLIDAETRLNPALGSLYGNGTKSGAGSTVRPSTPEAGDAKIVAALAKLSAADRVLAVAQRTCPIIANSRLGSMGVPIKLTLDGQTVFVCCKGCVSAAKEAPAATAARAAELRSGASMAVPTPEAKIRTNLDALLPADRALAEGQRLCPVTDLPLGSMGKPGKVMANGRPVFVCCASCDEDVRAKPTAMLDKIDRLKNSPQPKK